VPLIEEAAHWPLQPLAPLDLLLASGARDAPPPRPLPAAGWRGTAVVSSFDSPSRRRPPSSPVRPPHGNPSRLLPIRLGANAVAPPTATTTPSTTNRPPPPSPLAPAPAGGPHG
jgi:hypothetical protein